MKNLLFIIILSLSYSNFSYQSLLLPHSTYDLVSGYSQYSIFKKILFSQNIKKNVFISSTILPQDIQMSSINYVSLPFDYYNYFSINIIDYGQFTDSESNINFNAQDIILKNSLIKPINHTLYASMGLNYINSQIENYTSSAFCMQASLSIHYKNFLFQSSINNYGFIINHYTNYNESLPSYYSISLMYIPKYLNSNILIKHDVFNNSNITSIFGELLIKNDYSITAGYSSLAKKLYSEDFNSNFFTGISIGFNIKYFDYALNIGIKNLGATGLLHSITLNKSLN